MRKTLIYISLALASLVEMAMFVTAENYYQLLVAVVAYPVLVYLILRAFPKRAVRVAPKKIEEPEVGDIDKRGFLKMIGAAGLSFFLFSLFSRRAEVPFLEQLTGKKVEATKEGEDPTSNYRISEIDSEGAVTYYGFVKQGGAWFIMQEDTQVGSFRYIKGENGFPGNWVRREKLQYDYYHNVF